MNTDGAPGYGVTALDNGRFVFGYNELVLDDYRMKIFNADGSVFLPQTVIASPEPANTGSVWTEKLANGDFVYVWTEDRSGLGQQDMMGQIFDENGAAKTAQKRLAEVTNGIITEFELINMEDGGFALSPVVGGNGFTTADGYEYKNLIHSLFQTFDNNADPVSDVIVAQYGRADAIVDLTGDQFMVLSDWPNDAFSVIDAANGTTPNYDFELGGDADELFSASPDINYTYGGDGDDTIYTGIGDDVASGGSGSDLISGQGGDDFLTGDDPLGANWNDNDTIFGVRGTTLSMVVRGRMSSAAIRVMTP